MDEARSQMQKLVRSAFLNNHFVITRDNVKATEFQSTINNQYVYFITQVGLPRYIKIVVHPDIDFTRLGYSKEGTYHSSNMRRYPMKKHMGRKEIPYGIPFHLSLQELDDFLGKFNKL